MAEADQDRVKAAKFRRLKTPTLLQRRWLDEYNARVAGKREERKRITAGPEDAAPSSAHVVAPPIDLSADTYVWTPVVPEAAADEEAPPPGVEAPIPGAPVIDQQAPAGDPKAAAQMAMLVGMITRAGIQSALELSADLSLPAGYRDMMTNTAYHELFVTEVQAAAARLALKWNIGAIPMSDELVVGVAVGGSALCFVAVRKKRAKSAGNASPQSAKDANVRESAPPEEPTSVEDVPLAPPPIRGIWT